MSVRRRTSGRVNYNYFRDYDPASGRYIESDPIGLQGGLSTYGYVGADPLGLSDAFGPFDTGGSPGRAAGRIVANALARAAGTAAAGGGAANPVADAAAAGVMIGSIGFEIYDLCRPTPECERLFAIAEAAKDIVVSRYFKLLYDRFDQYNTAFDVPNLSRGTTWVGHQTAYREAQRVLQKAIDALLAEMGETTSP